MVLVSYSGREINAKIVYYGPGLSGKTTNLESIFSSIPEGHKGRMVSVKTKTERTLFFDFLPVNLGELSGFKTRFLLYTVPGQVYYNATRKLVLKGVDAVVFVADSQKDKLHENLESLQNLRDNLSEQGMKLEDIPWVLQYNKRDLPDVMSVEEMNKKISEQGVPFHCAVATTGEGVLDTFKEVSRLLLKHLSKEIGVKVVQPRALADATPTAEEKAPETEVPEAVAPEAKASAAEAPDAARPAPHPVVDAGSAPTGTPTATPRPEPIPMPTTPPAPEPVTAKAKREPVKGPVLPPATQAPVTFPRAPDQEPPPERRPRVVQDQPEPVSLESQQPEPVKVQAPPPEPVTFQAPPREPATPQALPPEPAAPQAPERPQVMPEAQQPIPSQAEPEEPEPFQMAEGKPTGPSFAQRLKRWFSRIEDEERATEVSPEEPIRSDTDDVFPTQALESESKRMPTDTPPGAPAEAEASVAQTKAGEAAVFQPETRPKALEPPPLETEPVGKVSEPAKPAKAEELPSVVPIPPVASSGRRSTPTAEEEQEELVIPVLLPSRNMKRSLVLKICIRFAEDGQISASKAEIDAQQRRAVDST